MKKVSVPHLLCNFIFIIVVYDIIIDSALLVTTKNRAIIQIYIYIFKNTSTLFLTQLMQILIFKACS